MRPEEIHKFFEFIAIFAGVMLFYIGYTLENKVPFKYKKWMQFVKWYGALQAIIDAWFYMGW